jgi:hypothetical protein
MTDKAKNPGGRPTDYNDEIAKAICEEIENTPRGIEYICNENDDFPSGRTVRRWLKQIPRFRPLYAQAKQIQAERMADEMLEVAYDSSHDWRVIVGVGGVEKIAFVPEAVNRSRLKIDTLKWQTEVLSPDKYNNKNLKHEDSLSKDSAVEFMKELANKCLQEKV